MTADPLQGIYVAPTADATGASGAWRRVYYGAVNIEWWGGVADGATDNATALAAMLVALPTGFALDFNTGTYVFSVFAATISQIRLNGVRDGTKILITGNGGGAPGPASNGGFRIFGSRIHLSGLTISYNNPALQCLVNLSGSVVTDNGRVIIEDCELTGEANITAATSIATGLYMDRLVNTMVRDSRIRFAVGFKQDVVMRGSCNSVHFDQVAFGPHAHDPANGVFWRGLYQVDQDGSSWATTFTRCTWEGGPNCIKVLTQGDVNIHGYMGDRPALGGYWLPGKTLIAGNTVWPSANTTGSVTSGATALTVASAAALYVGQHITVIGAGASGANLVARIVSISGLVATLSTAAGTTIAGAGVYYSNYSDHIYIVGTAGTTGASQPTWPTTSLGTVADNTVTWAEWGSGAAVCLSTVSGGSFGKYAVNIGGYIGGGIGVSAVRGGNRDIGSINLNGCDFVDNAICGHFDGVTANVNGGSVKGAADHWFKNKVGNIFATGVVDLTASPHEARFVIDSGFGSIVGAYPPVGLSPGSVIYNGSNRYRTAPSGNLTPTFNDDVINFTLTTTRTINDPTGTAVDAKEIIFRLRDNGSAKTINWGSQYRAVGTTIPTATVGGKLLVIRAIYNAADAKWDIVSVQQEA